MTKAQKDEVKTPKLKLYNTVINGVPTQVEAESVEAAQKSIEKLTK